jgi:PH (Pleckstrin Homology) domain-containing protein
MAESTRPMKVYRPFGARMVSAVSAGVLTALGVFLWLMLPGHVQDQFDWFQRGTLLAFFLGVLCVLYGVFRTRVAVSERGVSVINGYRHYDFSWPQIVAISMSEHRPWALVDLADGSTRALMALQTSDGPRAMRSAREIAAMISARSGIERSD